MRKLAYQCKIYDYQTMKEAEKHRDEMVKKGWLPVLQDIDNDTIGSLYKNGTLDYPYSIEYQK